MEHNTKPFSLSSVIVNYFTDIHLYITENHTVVRVDVKKTKPPRPEVFLIKNAFSYLSR